MSCAASCSLDARRSEDGASRGCRLKLQVDCQSAGVKIELDHGPINAPSCLLWVKSRLSSAQARVCYRPTAGMGSAIRLPTRHRNEAAKDFQFKYPAGIDLKKASSSCRVYGTAVTWIKHKLAGSSALYFSRKKRRNSGSPPNLVTKEYATMIAIACRNGCHKQRRVRE